jgi:hypothetical protein
MGLFLRFQSIPTPPGRRPATARHAQRAAKVPLGFHHEAVLVLLGQVFRGADDLLNQRRQIHGLRIKFELAGLNLREVEHLIDEDEQVGAGRIHATQRLQRLFRTEAPRIADRQLLGEMQRLMLADSVAKTILCIRARKIESRSGATVAPFFLTHGACPDALALQLDHQPPVSTRHRSAARNDWAFVFRARPMIPRAIPAKNMWGCIRRILIG